MGLSKGRLRFELFSLKKTSSVDLSFWFPSLREAYILNFSLYIELLKRFGGEWCWSLRPFKMFSLSLDQAEKMKFSIKRGGG